MWQGFQYQYPHQTEKNRLANAANQPCCICTLLFVGVADFGLSRLEESHNFSSPTTSTSGVVSSPGESTQPGLGPWKIWGSHMRLKWRNFRNSVKWRCFVYLNAEKCLLRRRRSRELDEDLEGKDLTSLCFYWSLGQEMSSTGPKAQNMTSDARHGPIGSFYHFHCFLFWGTVQSKVPGSWVWSAPSRAFAQKLIQCWWSGNFGPHDLLFSIIFQASAPVILHAFGNPTNWTVFFWDSGPSRDLRPLPFFA